MKTKIIIIGLIMNVLYALLAYIRFGFSHISIPSRDDTIILYFLLINLGLFISYFVAYRLIRGEVNQRKILKTIVFFAIVFSVILVLIPPMGSEDVFNYIFRARVSTVYGENPYMVTTNNFESDLFFPFANKKWNDNLMQYGPLWTSVSIGFSYLAQDNFFWNQFLYKLFALAINFGMIYFIWRILSLINPKHRLKGLLLYAWNPLILFETVNNGHNDIFMVFLIVVAVYLFLSKKYLFSFLLIILSVLVKYVTLFLVPIFLIYILREITSRKEQKKFLFKASILSLAVVILFYLPYWDGFQIFKGLLIQYKMNEFGGLSLFPGFVFGIIILFKSIFSWSFDHIMQIVGTVGIIAFALIYSWQLKIIWKKRDDFIYRIFLILFIYILYSFVYLQPWYFLWFLPFAILINKRYFLEFIFLFTLIGLLSYYFSTIMFQFVIFFDILLFLYFFTKRRYFSSFLGFR